VLSSWRSARGCRSSGSPGRQKHAKRHPDGPCGCSRPRSPQPVVAQSEGGRAGAVSRQPKAAPCTRTRSWRARPQDREAGRGRAVTLVFGRPAPLTWAEAGVGAIVTQSFIDPKLRSASASNSCAAASRRRPRLRRSLRPTRGRDVRQVAIVDTEGRVAAHTGAKVHRGQAGHQDRSAVLGAGQPDGETTVWPAHGRVAFESATGELAERMLAALEAGET